MMDKQNQTAPGVRANVLGEPRKIELPASSRLTQRTLQHLDDFLDFAPPGQLKQQLLYVFMLFLSHEYNTLPGNFKDIAEDYLLLFKWLDVVEEEMNTLNKENDVAL